MIKLEINRDDLKELTISGIPSDIVKETHALIGAVAHVLYTKATNGLGELAMALYRSELHDLVEDETFWNICAGKTILNDESEEEA